MIRPRLIRRRRRHFWWPRVPGGQVRINLSEESRATAGQRSYWVEPTTGPAADWPGESKPEPSLTVLGYASSELLQDSSALHATMLRAFTDELRFLTRGGVIASSLASTGYTRRFEVCWGRRRYGLTVRIGPGWLARLVGSLLPVPLGDQPVPACDPIVEENLTKLWGGLYSPVASRRKP